MVHEPLAIKEFVETFVIEFPWRNNTWITYTGYGNETKVNNVCPIFNTNCYGLSHEFKDLFVYARKDADPEQICDIGMQVFVAQHCVNVFPFHACRAYSNDRVHAALQLAENCWVGVRVQ